MILCIILASSQLASANSTNPIVEPNGEIVSLLNEAILVSTFIGGNLDAKVSCICEVQLSSTRFMFTINKLPRYDAQTRLI